jgi:formiminotetrahydrofolate cyclodeaminase
LLTDLTIKDFLKKTASNSPVPGGGSIAALSGAISASLLEMVASLTIGKKGYEEFEEEMKEISIAVLEYRNKLIADIDKDSNAYDAVMAAYRLPKSNDEERDRRSGAIQEALKNAVLVPLEVAKMGLDIIKLAGNIVRDGNKNAITDGAVAAMMARTALLSALYNVKINLSSIKDEAFVNEISDQVRDMENKIQKLEQGILAEIDL